MGHINVTTAAQKLRKWMSKNESKDNRFGCDSWFC